METYFREKMNEHIEMNGKILYRFGSDQLELEGFWSINSELNKERFSYLFIKPTDKLDYFVNKEEIESLDSDNKISKIFPIHISTCNIHEIILLPHEKLFNQVLKYLSSEYCGYFIYFSKTIEDKFYLSFEPSNSQIKISGKGHNNLGSFCLIGYAKFYLTKGNVY